MVLSVAESENGRSEHCVVSYCIFASAPFVIDATLAGGKKHAYKSRLSADDTTTESLLAVFDGAPAEGKSAA